MPIGSVTPYRLIRHGALSFRSASISDLQADDFSRHNQLDATVLLSPLGGIVVGNRRGLAEATSRDTLRGQALLDQIAAHGVGTLLRERLIQLVTTRAIRVAFHVESQTGMRQRNSREPR